MLSSASTDLAKVWLDRNGWPAATELLRRHNLVPTTDWGKKASALMLIVANGFVDWYKAEDTPMARFLKDIIKDVPSELIVRLWDRQPPSCSPNAPAHPLAGMEREELNNLMRCVRTLDHAAQMRLRLLIAHAGVAELKLLAMADGENLATLVDLLAPDAPNEPTPRPSLGDRLAHFLVPNLGHR
jgi:hypothetical protein